MLHKEIEFVVESRLVMLQCDCGHIMQPVGAELYLCPKCRNTAASEISYPLVKYFIKDYCKKNNAVCTKKCITSNYPYAYRTCPEYNWEIDADSLTF